MFIFSSVSLSTYFALCLCICMSFASGCSQGQYRPVVWSYSRSTRKRWPAERQPASHQLKRWSDCSFSAYRIWRMTHYLHTLNFSAAVISFAHLDQHQLWTENVLSGNLRHKAVKNLARYFLVIKVNNLDFCLFCLKYWEPSLIQVIRPVILPENTYSFPRSQGSVISLDQSRYLDWIDNLY